MSSAATGSRTIRYAARCARPQCARKSASIASFEPACAARTQAHSRRCEGRAKPVGPPWAAARSIADARARADTILSPPGSTGNAWEEVPGGRILSMRMQDRGDSWTRAGADTRADVREIFARHAAATGALPGAAPDRFDPLPGFLMLPVRGWRALSP